MTLADCKWHAAAPGLNPSACRAPDRPCQPVFCGQVLTCTESATSEYSTTSQCLSALLGSAMESEVYPRRHQIKKENPCTYTRSTAR